MEEELETGVIKKFLYVNRRAPHGTVYAHEALEVVLIGAAFDQEFSAISVAYTTGGMTISASQTEAENATTSGNEESLWNLGLSFAF